MEGRIENVMQFRVGKTLLSMGWALLGGAAYCKALHNE